MANEKFTYGDLPDDMITKPYLPLSRHAWRLYQNLGYKAFFEEIAPRMGTDVIYDMMKLRLDESIFTARDVLEGSIKHPDKRLAWMMFPPVIPLRADLTQGTMKLLYGDSLDMTFFALSDLDQELLFILNGHMENGIPVDWWIVGPEDEVFERRHIKYGFKLKDAFKNSRDITKCGFQVMDVLRDIRNERTPQWASTPYCVCIVWFTGVIGFMVELSMFELVGMIWDGVGAKRIYGLPDYWFAYIPWPSMVRLLLFMNRGDFILRLGGLLSGNRLCINHLEANLLDTIKEMLDGTDFWEEAFINTAKLGFPWPSQSITVEPPNLKKKSSYKKSEFDWNYSKERWLTPDDFGMTFEEITRGILLNITHKTKPWSVDPKDEIISIGWGRNIDVYQDIIL